MQLQLRDLRMAIGASRWPKVEQTKDAPSWGAFYPGKVLVGRHRGQPVWAFLIKATERGETKVCYCSDDGLTLTSSAPGSVLSWNISFKPWCVLIVEPSVDPVGCVGAWSDRAKTVIKLALLDAGHYDGSSTRYDKNFTTLLNIIRRNPMSMEDSAKAPSTDATPGKERPQSAPSERHQPSPVSGVRDHAAASTPPLAAVDSEDTQPATSAEHGGATEAHFANVASDCIAKLKTVIPSRFWFKVYASEDHKGIDADPFTGGKVLLGRTNVCSPKLPVWASFTTGICMVYYLDDQKRARQHPDGLDGPINFEPIFHLLTDEDHTVLARRHRAAMISVLVRLALVDAGWLTVPAAKLDGPISLSLVLDVVQKNLANGGLQRLEAAEGETALQPQTREPPSATQTSTLDAHRPEGAAQPDPGAPAATGPTSLGGAGSHAPGGGVNHNATGSRSNEVINMRIRSLSPDPSASAPSFGTPHASGIAQGQKQTPERVNEEEHPVLRSSPDRSIRRKSPSVMLPSKRPHDTAPSEEKDSSPSDHRSKRNCSVLQETEGSATTSPTKSTGTEAAGSKSSERHSTIEPRDKRKEAGEKFRQQNKRLIADVKTLTKVKDDLESQLLDTATELDNAEIENFELKMQLQSANKESQDLRKSLSELETKHNVLNVRLIKAEAEKQMQKVRCLDTAHPSTTPP